VSECASQALFLGPRNSDDLIIPKKKERKRKERKECITHTEFQFNSFQ
jgi:hypothetical protein